MLIYAINKSDLPEQEFPTHLVWKQTAVSADLRLDCEEEDANLRPHPA